jgi:hypothetical protein
VVRAGGDWDRWDLQVRGGLLGSARLRTAIEEHGQGRQLVRVRSWPHAPAGATILAALLAALAVAMLAGSFTATVIVAIVSTIVAARVCHECGTATTAIRRAVVELPYQTASAGSRRSFDIALALHPVAD